MSNADHFRAITDINSWNEFRKKPAPGYVDLTKEAFEGRSFDEWNLSNADFSECKFVRVSFVNSKLFNVQFQRCEFVDCDFSHADLTQAQFNYSVLTKVSFLGAKLQHTGFIEATTSEMDFTDAYLGGMFDKAKLPGAKFDGATLYGGTFAGCDLRNARFIGADFSGGKFPGADLREADLRMASLQGGQLFGANVDRAKIRRYDLEDIKAENYCGLKPSQIQRMDVEDGYGELRGSFSGFWTYLHGLSILIWLGPILFIVGRSLLLSRMPQDLGARYFVEIPLWEQILGYCKSGMLFPKRSEIDPFWAYPSMPLFWVTWLPILFYNVSRGWLMYRVKSLEHKQSITGMHPLVSIEGKTKFFYVVANKLFWLNLVFVLGHLINFLAKVFPAPIRGQ